MKATVRSNLLSLSIVNPISVTDTLRQSKVPRPHYDQLGGPARARFTIYDFGRHNGRNQSILLQYYCSSTTVVIAVRHNLTMRLVY
jgi:hypothetical protein